MKFFTKSTPPPAAVPVPAPVHLYYPGKLAGESMAPAQLASAMQGNRENPGLRAALQVIEAYAHEALALSTEEVRIHSGQAAGYLMAHSFYSNMLADFAEYLAGRVPDVPARPRLQPQHPKLHEN